MGKLTKQQQQLIAEHLLFLSLGEAIFIGITC